MAHLSVSPDAILMTKAVIEDAQPDSAVEFSPYSSGSPVSAENQLDLE
jgi:hypothetical protein